MAKYLVIASYTAEGIKGVVEKGGTARVQASRKLVESVGGKLESFHFGFGEDDVYLICDIPDNVSAAAVAMTAASSGLLSTRMVVLLTPEEIDRAAEMNLSYEPPGA
jgi:uncharacterized protein with GYD domain